MAFKLQFYSLTCLLNIQFKNNNNNNKKILLYYLGFQEKYEFSFLWSFFVLTKNRDF